MGQFFLSELHSWTRDGQRPQTEMSPVEMERGWVVARRSDSGCFGGSAGARVGVLCLFSELLGSFFPVLPHPCQTLHGTVNRSRAISYPPELAFLQPVSANHSSEDDRPTRSDLCGGRPAETHQGSPQSRVSVRFLFEMCLNTSIRSLETSGSAVKEKRFPDNHMTHSLLEFYFLLFIYPAVGHTLHT